MLRTPFTIAAGAATTGILGINFWWLALLVAAVVWVWMKPTTSTKMLFIVDGETGQASMQPQDKHFDRYMGTRK
jgi:hypothetical protein